jgi:hypothetical protein
MTVCRQDVMRQLQVCNDGASARLARFSSTAPDSLGVGGTGFSSAAAAAVAEQILGVVLVEVRHESPQRSGVLADALAYDVKRASAFRDATNWTQAARRIQHGELCAPFVSRRC